jgi:hypothetical protein
MWSVSVSVVLLLCIQCCLGFRVSERVSVGMGMGTRVSERVSVARSPLRSSSALRLIRGRSGVSERVSERVSGKEKAPLLLRAARGEEVERVPVWM